MPTTRKQTSKDKNSKKKSQKKIIEPGAISKGKVTLTKTKKRPVKKQKLPRERPSKQKIPEQAKISGQTNFELADWKKQKVCCGSVSIGPQNQVLIEPKEIKKHVGKCMMETVSAIVTDQKESISQMKKKSSYVKVQKTISKKGLRK